MYLPNIKVFSASAISKRERPLSRTQLLLGRRPDNNIYQGGTLQEVTVYGNGTQKKLQLYVPTIQAPELPTIYDVNLYE